MPFHLARASGDSHTEVDTIGRNFVYSAKLHILRAFEPISRRTRSEKLPRYARRNEILPPADHSMNGTPPMAKQVFDFDSGTELDTAGEKGGMQTMKT